MAKERYTTAQVIEALQQTRGIMSLAARLLGCTRWTIYNYIERHPTVKQAYEEQRQTIVDLAEGQLVKKLDAGEWPAIKFILATLGRDRGYVERQELTGADKGEIVVRLVGNVSPDDV